MAYSASLAARVRQLVGPAGAIVEKRLFGGLGFLLRGNLLVAVWGANLIARIGVDATAKALREPFVRPFDVTGKPMKGWIVVEADGLDTDRELAEWITRARDFVETLPPK
jgi:TfoX/Sxy family transcriptional regulator of competence genes